MQEKKMENEVKLVVYLGLFGQKLDWMTAVYKYGD